MREVDPTPQFSKFVIKRKKKKFNFFGAGLIFWGGNFFWESGDILLQNSYKPSQDLERDLANYWTDVVLIYNIASQNYLGEVPTPLQEKLAKEKIPPSPQIWFYFFGHQGLGNPELI